MLLSKIMERMGDSLENVSNCKGIFVKHNEDYIDVGEQEEFFVNSNYLDDHMVVYVLSRMLKEGKIAFLGDCDKDIRYLEKLVKENDKKTS